MPEPYKTQYLDDMPKPEPAAAAAPAPLGVLKIALAVFLGNILTGALAAAIYFAIR
jgi:hypothetical protein